MKSGKLLFFNSFSLLLVLIANFAFGSGAIGIPSVGDISDQYPTLLTPAGYAFSIWGVIYLLLIGFVIYQWMGKAEDSLIPSGWWFSLSNLFNILWIICWVNGLIFISTILIFLLLYSLMQLVFRLRLEVWDAPMRIIALVWWPICIYTGWMVLASVLNVSVLLVSLEWDTWGISPEYWAVGITGIAVGIYSVLTFKRNMREAALVGSWGFIAIALKADLSSDLVYWTAIIAAIFLFFLVNYHAFKNYHYLPFFKLKRGEI